VDGAPPALAPRPEGRGRPQRSTRPARRPGSSTGLGTASWGQVWTHRSRDGLRCRLARSGRGPLPLSPHRRGCSCRRASSRTHVIPIPAGGPAHDARGGRVAEEAQGEAHIPAQQAPAGDTPRVPSPHEHPRRPGDRPGPAPQGAHSSVGLIGRIGDRATFEALRRSGYRARRGATTVVYLPARSPGEPAASRARGESRGDVRFAYAVGRRVGPAVVRNRLRRRLRAAVRDLDRATGELPSGAYLVSLRPEAAAMSYAELRHDLSRAITRATERASTPAPSDGSSTDDAGARR
jgi:ribonuclease P protein component